ncbi:MAG: hypothetical protein U1E66_01365 [Rhodospirillales bacterium]
MPRKPNYRFERAERDRAKAAKKAERLKARKERANAGDEEETTVVDEDGEVGDGGGEADARTHPDD